MHIRQTLSLSRITFRPAMLLAALLTLLAAALLLPSVALAQSASLTATVNSDRSVDLTLSNGPSGDWWFRINSGSCTAVSGTSVNGIQGYKAGTYSVRAYSDGNCGAEIANTTFTIPTASLAATVNSNRSVDLTLSNGPSNWYFRIGYGSCVAVSGTTVSGIQGYQTGFYSVGAFSGAGCKGFIAVADFIIPGPAAAHSNPGDHGEPRSVGGPDADQRAEQLVVPYQLVGQLHGSNRKQRQQHPGLRAGNVRRRCLFRQRLQRQDCVVIIHHSDPGTGGNGEREPFGGLDAQRRPDQLVVPHRLVGQLHGGERKRRQQHPRLPVGIVHRGGLSCLRTAPSARTSRRSRSRFPPQP